MPYAQQEWLTVAETAALLGVSTKTIRRRIADGALPAWRIGTRMLRVRAVDVERLLRRVPAAGVRAA